MPLAIFDLDNTLLAGDSDHLWGEFLVENGVVDADHYRRQNDQFYQDYQAGHLDIQAFLRFSLAPLSRHPVDRLLQWRTDFLARKIDPIITRAARDLVERHRAAGDTLLIITATNRFVTAPIAERFRIPHLIATEPAMAGDTYTGEVIGVPSFREGKITRLQTWLAEQGFSLEGSCFYSDSHNDLPLLSRVDHPCAVDPDPPLRDHARSRGWPIISLRDALATA